MTLTNLLDIYLIAMFVTAVVLWLRYQRKIIRAELVDEASTGLLGREEAERAPRHTRALGALLGTDQAAASSSSGGTCAGCTAS